MSKNLLKAGILLGILVIPAFVFIFLNTFGENKFDLPYYFPELNERGEALIVEGDTVFHQVPDFRLTDEKSDSFDLADLDGSIKVVSFFFSRCGTICPVLNTNISRVAESFSKVPDLNFLSITVDPQHDTPEALEKYVEENSFSTKNWNFLTGEKAYIYDLAIKGFKLPVADASEYDQQIKDIDEQFIHSEKILLLDGDNFVRGIYEGTSKEDMSRLRVEIKVLLDSKDKE